MLLKRFWHQQPFTTSVVPLIILIPLVFLGWGSLKSKFDRVDDPRLFRLFRQSRLIQSFEVDSDQDVPAIWTRRLGGTAASKRWKASSGRLWWKAWMEDGQPVLVLGGEQRSSPSTLHFADELHRRTYEANRSSVALSPSNLEQECFRRLSSTTSVMWTSSGLASIAGPAVSVMNAASHGCLSLTLRSGRLGFRGPVGSRPLSAAPATLRLPRTVQRSKRTTREPSPQFLNDQPLLQLWSPIADPVLGVLARRPLIRDQLEIRYGLSPNLLERLMKAPMKLTIHPQSSGAFRAGLQLNLDLNASEKQATQQALRTIGDRLQKRGLTSEPLISQPGQVPGTGSGMSWANGEQTLGGWFLVDQKESLRLQLALGQSPLRWSSPALHDHHQTLRLLMVPRSLTAIGWISPAWPALVREASRLELALTPMEGEPSVRRYWDWLEGELSVR